jgi:hypothetical protein
MKSRLPDEVLHPAATIRRAARTNSRTSFDIE